MGNHGPPRTDSSAGIAVSMLRPLTPTGLTGLIDDLGRYAAARGSWPARAWAHDPATVLRPTAPRWRGAWSGRPPPPAPTRPVRRAPDRRATRARARHRGPSRPCTRATARAARSADAVSPPQNPNCRPLAAVTSSGTNANRVMPAVGRAAADPLSQPSSCQRTRSATAAALNAPSWRHNRSRCSPCSVSATINTRVQARPRSSRRSCSSSAKDLATNAAVSTRSAGGSSSATAWSSTGGGSVAGGRSSSPRASR